MTTNAIRELFNSASKKVRADFEESRQTRHHGSRGTEREEIVAKFLRLYVPRTVEVVHNAEIITATGETSKQCDLVIIDANTPKLRSMESHHIIPAECVFGVIEVKSHLTGPELADACLNIAEVKKLSRIAYMKPVPLDFRGAQYPPLPIFGYVFAFNGIQLQNLGKRFSDWCTRHPREHHPDGVWINDNGILVWGPGRGSDRWHAAISYPQLKRELLLLGSRQEGDVLLGMIVGISSMLTRPLPQLDFNTYYSDGLDYPVEGRISLSDS